MTPLSRPAFVAVILAVTVGIALAGEPVFRATTTVRDVAPPESAAVTIVSRQEIEATNAVSVADLLLVYGVHVSGAAAGGGPRSARLRGGDGNFTLVTIDGVAINDPTDSFGGAVDLGSLSVAGIERIEIVRGPGARSGPGALGGAIHLFRVRANGLEAELEWGTPDRQRGLLLYGQRRGDLIHYHLAVDAEGDQQRVAAESSSRFGVAVGGTFELAREARCEFGVDASHHDRDDYSESSGGPLYGDGMLRDSEFRDRSLRAALSLGPAASPRFSIDWTSRGQWLHRDSPGIGFAVPASSERTRHRRDRLKVATRFLDRDRLELDFGLHLDVERGRNQSVLLLPDALGGRTPGDYEVRRTTGGGFTTITAMLGEVAVDGSLRLDLSHDQGWQWSPRIGARRPLGHGVWARASLAHTVKPPSFFALASPPQLGGNPDLKAERGLGGDVGLEWTRVGSALTLGVGGFVQRYSDLVDFDFATFRHINRASVDARGLELDGRYRGAKWSLTFGLTWERAVDSDSGDGLSERPALHGSLLVGYTLREGYEVALGASGVSSRLNHQIPVPDRDRSPGFSVFALSGRARLSPLFSAGWRVDNLLDRGYENLIGFPAPGRSLRVDLRYRQGR